jgi:hypothetical protein
MIRLLFGKSTQDMIRHTIPGFGTTDTYSKAHEITPPKGIH